MRGRSEPRDSPSGADLAVACETIMPEAVFGLRTAAVRSRHVRLARVDDGHRGAVRVRLADPSVNARAGRGDEMLDHRLPRIGASHHSIVLHTRREHNPSRLLLLRRRHPKRTSDQPTKPDQTLTAGSYTDKEAPRTSGSLA
jgi:hypothetical protein